MPHKVLHQAAGQNGNTPPLHTADLFKKTNAEAIQDVVGIGFGPASLAIAVAIYDLLEERALKGSTSFMPKLRFLERQSTFHWHAGMLLPGTKMQISFIKDLATLRNPRSHFTFLNYLKEHGRLVQFSNLNTFLPFRVEFEDYLKWSASHFSDMVKYSQDVVSVRPFKLSECHKFNCLEITARDSTTGATSHHLGRKVIIAVGGRPSIPPMFPQHDERIIHSSEYNDHIKNVLPIKDKAYNIAVVGAGQSAAEVFNDIHTRYPNSKSYLLIRDTAMRPSDDSPFVNEIFNPEAVDHFYASPPQIRSSQLKSNKPTNYSVVRLPLLEQIYETMYHQRMTEADSKRWQHRILPCCEVVEATNELQSNQINLVIKKLQSQTGTDNEMISVDAVILATGYVRDVHNEILRECQVINGSADGTWTPQRDYKVELNHQVVEEDVQIYLQGCNEKSHGLSDTLLSILANRGGEVAESIFGQRLLEASAQDLVNRARGDTNGPLGPLWKHHKVSTDGSSDRAATQIKARA